MFFTLTMSTCLC